MTIFETIRNNKQKYLNNFVLSFMPQKILDFEFEPVFTSEYNNSYSSVYVKKINEYDSWDMMITINTSNVCVSLDYCKDGDEYGIDIEYFNDFNEETIKDIEKFIKKTTKKLPKLPD